MTEEIKDMELTDEDAFEDAISKLMGDDTDEEDTDLDSDSEVKDTEDADEDVQDTDTKDEEEESDRIDYEALYNQTRSHNAALQKNLEHVESQFNSWKGRVEAEQKRHKEEQEKQDAKKQEEKLEISEDLQDLIELYPGLIPQVQALIDSKVSKEVSGVEARVAQLIDKEVSPVAARMKESELHAHETAILSAHPDIHDVIADGSFRRWVETLHPYQQIGARHICDVGSAQEVIDLFNDFKAATSKGAAINNDIKTSPKKKTESKKVVENLKNAMSVPSEMSSPDLNSITDPSDLNKVFAIAEKEILRENKFL